MEERQKDIAVAARAKARLTECIQMRGDEVPFQKGLGRAESKATLILELSIFYILPTVIDQPELKVTTR